MFRISLILNLLIFIFILLNLLLYCAKFNYDRYPSIKYGIKEGKTYLRKYKFNNSLNNQTFNMKLLNNASNFIGLSNNPSFHPKLCKKYYSELQCDEIIEAYKTISKWEEESKKRGEKYLLCTTENFDFEQKIQTEAVCLSIAIMTNRNLLLESQTIQQTNSIITNVSKILEIKSKYNIIQILNKDKLLLGHSIETDDHLIGNDDVLPYSILYIHPELNNFCFNHFYTHAALLLSYYLYSDSFFTNKLTLSNLRLDINENMQNQEITKKIIGVHVDFEKNTPNKIAQLGSSNIRKKLKALRSIRPISVNLVSDSLAFVQEFEKDFGETNFSLILTHSSDIIDHYSSAHVVLSSDEKIYTIQSAFSQILSKLSFRPPIWYERDKGKFFTTSSSQSFLVSPFVNNITSSQANDVLHVTEENENSIRELITYFFI